MKRKQKESLAAGLTFGAVLLAAIGGTAAVNLHTNEVTCTVQDKESVNKKSDHEYRVYTEECGVLSVGDNLLRWHFDSADVYASLEVGSTYNLTTTGWRVPLLSLMPNIIEATPAR